MALHENARFARSGGEPPADVLRTVPGQFSTALNRAGWVHCGYSSIESIGGVVRPSVDVDALVDNAFRLGMTLGFEQVPVIVTTGLRTSRFAPVLFWEVLHALAPGGLWIDVDEARRCHGTPLIAEDFPVREYFRTCLRSQSHEMAGGWAVQAFLKTTSAPLAAYVGDRGWTFGILTSGPSPHAARMAAAILKLDLPDVEVIFCGPCPDDAPRDPRVRAIDLERPEPRGWITRKKNLIADAARYDNLCLLHDRFVITPEWADALRAYGPCYSFVTFPQQFFADVDHRFTQRYADYQLLHQSQGVERALASRIYAGEHVLYPAYDDFSETAFCCGGLYIAKRCLWNRVRQDEGLFHSEWEDVTFGLECQRQGLPHRVNPFLTVESVTPHPMALTRMHELVAPDRVLRGRLHVSTAQEEAARLTPRRFKPVIISTRARYYGKVIDRFNAIPDLPASERMVRADVDSCRGLSDFWRVIERRIDGLQFGKRQEIAEVAFFLSDTIYNWPNCELQAWIRANELIFAAPAPLDGFDDVVGWGTGSLFASSHRTIGRDLAFIVDRDVRRWGGRVAGLEIRPPSALRDCDPARTAVVVFSCFAGEIAAAVAAIGPFSVFPAHAVATERRFRPLVDMVSHFDEIERYYPTLFVDARNLRVAA